MRWRPAPALVLAAAMALPAAAQAPGAPPPFPQAEPPVASPRSGPEAPEPAPENRRDLAAPPLRPPPRPAAEGESESPPVPAADIPSPEADEAAATPPSAGALIPPEAYAEPVAPFQPAGPPARELLRESDFDHAACRYGLTLLGVDYAEIPPLADAAERDCGIARPIELRAVQPGVVLEGGAAMRCDTARALALWTREMVIPAAGRMEGSPRLTSMAVGTGYQCRGVVGAASEARLSEHALGNAIDIAGFGFSDGSRIDIAPAADRGDLGAAFQNAVQGSACLYFSTVLGPGSNDAHADHLHLDIKARQSGFRLCQ